MGFPIRRDLWSIRPMDRTFAEHAVRPSTDRLKSHEKPPHRVTLVNLSKLTERKRGRPAERFERGLKRFSRLSAALFAIVASLSAPAALADTLLLRPARVFDGVNPTPHAGWSVLVDGDKISAVGPNLAAPAGAKVVDLPGETLIPGMIEGHSHLFLHPYNETLWDDQVLHEPLALRTARAVVHAEKTLDAGFTTERDLGTEGAGFADVGLKRSTRASSPALACSLRPRRLSRAALTGRKATSPACPFRREPRKSAALMK